MTDTVDVLIVGDGIAGCCAAIAAHDQGAHVVVIDKAPQDVPHGNTAFSGGAFRRTGVEYPAEQFLADLMRLSGNRADPEIARIVVERSADAQLWLEDIGVRFPAELGSWDKPLKSRTAGEHWRLQCDRRSVGVGSKFAL